MKRLIFISLSIWAVLLNTMIVKAETIHDIVTFDGITYELISNLDYKDNQIVARVKSIDQNIINLNIPPTISLSDGNCYQVEFIGENACSSYNLKSVSIPYTITDVGYQAFGDCINLESIHISEGVTTIGNFSFLGCSSLTYVNLPNSVTYIGISAFYNCRNLTRINLPSQVTYIGKSVFTGCSNLALLVAERTDPQEYNCDDKDFTDRGSTNLVVPSKSLSKYQRKYPWTYFKNIIGDLHYGQFPIQHVDELENAQVYTITTERAAWWAGRIMSPTTVFKSSSIPEQFAIIQRYGKYYIYSLGAKSIFNGITSDDPNIGTFVSQDCQPVTIIETGNLAYPLSFSYGEQYHVNINKDGEFRVDAQSLTDKGCRVAVQPIEGVWLSEEELNEIYAMVTSITIVPDEVTLYTRGEHAQLSAIIEPGDVNGNSVTWESSNPSVVTVDDNGLVTALEKGSVIITATTADGTNKTATCIVNSNLTIEHGSLYVEQPLGERNTLNIGCEFENSNITAYQFDLYLPSGIRLLYDEEEGEYCVSLSNRHQNDHRCAVRDHGNGRYSFVVSSNYQSTISAGNDVLLSLTLDIDSSVGGWQPVSIKKFIMAERNQRKQCFDDLNQACDFTIYASGIYLNEYDITLTSEGEEVQLFATIVPDNVTYKDVSWTSSDESIVTVDANGIVTAIDSGTAKISAATTDGTDLVAECNVSVNINVYSVTIGDIGYLLYPESGQATISYNEVTEGDGSIIIPYEVTYLGRTYQVKSIANEAFKDCAALTSVYIPDNVTNIGNYAFANCSGLAYVDIPEGVITIGKYAFKGCDNMESLTIPSSIKNIGEKAFEGCNKLKSLNINTSSVDSWFSRMPSITSITLGDNVTKINDSAFYGCSSLASINIPDGVRTIESHAFHDCSSLTSITIPSSTWYIGSYAFYGCTSLSSVLIYGDIRLSNAFKDCSNLRSVTINSSSIVPLFAGISSITDVILGENVESIEDEAFMGCGLTSIYIPNNVTSIGREAFSVCSDLVSMIVDGGNIIYDSRDNCNAIIETATNTLIAGSMNTVIPESVTSIGDYAFCGSSNLTAITIPESVTSIGLSAFHSCYGLTYITIPRTMTSIGDLAFCRCNSLTDVYCYAEQIPNTTSCTFENSNIESATIHVPAASLDAYRQTEPWCNFGNIVAIGDDGGDNTIIDFADANVKAICVANWDTNGDGELSEEEAAAVTDLGGAFYGNAEIISFDELQYFTGLTYINRSAFNNCTNLASVGLPNTLTSIEGYAFYCCQSLTSVVIPESVTWIGESAFQNCYNLTSANLPSGITTINPYLFCGCKLNSITIPSGVTSIGELAFYSDSRADDVWCYAENIPSTGDNAFNNWLIHSSTLHVLAASLQAYRTTEPWSGFGTIVAIDAGRVIDDLSDLSNEKQYIIRTKDEARGSLGVANGELASTNPSAIGHKCEEATPFAILWYDGYYYLYSTADRKFITNKGGETDVPGQNGRHAVTVTKNTNGYFMFSFTSTGNVINVNNNPGIDINDWGQTEDKWDDGNQFTIEEVGDFNPTEALATFDDAQYMAALQSIETGTQYTIYTVYNGTRYYLTNAGYLTEEPEDNCIFTFYNIWNNDLYRSPGWKLDACFSNPQLTNDATGDLLLQGHLLTDTQNRDDWEGQIWYLGDNGCYAVRATNARSNEWGAQTYWTVLDSDGNGQPEADYSWTPAFVWQIEHDKDFIDGISPLLTSPEEEGQVYKQSSTIVNLAGQRVNKLQQGINIRQKNGRTQKILMK